MSSSFPEAAVLAPEDLRVGRTAQFERDITEDDIYAFARLSGDANPLHVDSDYAAATNFGRRIVHGAFQVGLASALIGMYLPGRNVLLGTVSARFPSPLSFPTRVLVSGQITSWNESSRAGIVRITIQEAKSHTPTAEILMNVAWHEQRDGGEQRAASASSTPPRFDPGRPIVVVTGAGGGLGSELLANLADDYNVVALVRRPGAVTPGERIVEVVGDLQDPSWRDALRAALGDRRLYGIVHAAWPGQPHGSLLQLDEQVVQQQLNFGAMSTIELARFLFNQPEAENASGRLVVLGSIVGTLKPVLPLASYSLGKAAVEQTVKLLAPELARRQITVNAISPSFIATGLNRQATDRQQMKEAALVPLGRVCRTGDVTGAVRFLLSPEAGFISGQTLGLTGAQL